MLAACIVAIILARNKPNRRRTSISADGSSHPEGGVPFDGSTDVWPTPAELAMDVWSAPEVQISSQNPVSRVFGVLPSGKHFEPGLMSSWRRRPNGTYHKQKVVIFDVPAAVDWVPEDIPCDSAHAIPKWNGLGASQGAEVTSDICWFDDHEVMSRAAERFSNAFGGVLREEFGVSAEPCKLARGLYATRVKRGADADDEWHHDICKPAPDIFLTVLAYPHDRGWKPEWQGHTEFARVDCAVEPPPQTNRTPPALRVAPMPNRTVIFGGRIFHTTSRVVGMSRRSRRRDKKAARNRYSVVLRLHCQAG